jgi:hypothetical protein
MIKDYSAAAELAGGKPAIVDRAVDSVTAKAGYRAGFRNRVSRRSAPSFRRRKSERHENAHK